jgi:ABC-2 type transport system ATP-binding protein
MSSNDAAISVKGVGKSFRLPHEQHSGFKQFVIKTLQGKGAKGYENQHVLGNITFDVKKGEFFGIVGRNGSGKSTLLKLLAGIYTPDKGEIKIDGTLVPFIELGVGFNPELTGRENVFLNGALLGFSRKQMEAMYDEIVEFAELGRFMDQKLKNYSSGMQVRLAFSIAIRADSDILVLDEVLAVGDEAFQRKCYSYFAELKRNKKTVILVTHSMDSVQQFCNRAIMIEKGEIIMEGNPAKVAQKYRELFMSEETEVDESGEVVNKEQPVDIVAKATKSLRTIMLHVELTPKQDISDSILTIFIDRDSGEQVYRFATDEKTGKSFDLKKGKTVKVNIELQNIFPKGTFTLRASVKSADRTMEYASIGELAKFDIDNRIKSGSEWDVHWRPREEFTIE